MHDERSLYQRFGVLLKRLRQNEGVTQQGLADNVGLSRTSIANIEAGNQAVTLATLYALAHALAQPVDRLLPKSPEPRDLIQEAGLSADTEQDLLDLWDEPLEED